MGFPAAIGGVGMAAQVAQGVVGFLGAQATSQAQQNTYNYQAGVANLNAQIEKQNANYSLEVGDVQAEQQGLKTRAEIGRTIATQGAGNVDVSSGSAKDVRSSEIEIGQQNEGIVRADAAKRAYGAQVKGVQDTAQAAVYTMGAETAKTTGEIGEISSIIGAAGGVSDKWLQGQSKGLWS